MEQAHTDGQLKSDKFVYEEFTQVFVNSMLEESVRKVKKDGILAFLRSAVRFIGRKIRPRFCWQRSSWRIWHQYQRLQYGQSAPKPYDLITIDPNDIDYFIFPQLVMPKTKRYFRTFVIGGDWDQTINKKCWTKSDRPNKSQLYPIDESLMFQSFKSHFKNNIPWTETEFYSYCDSYPMNVSEFYRDPEDRLERLEKIDDLYEHMKTKGYKSQRELKKDSESPFSVKKGIPEEHELSVAIGRDGNIFREHQARHRLLIAKLIGIEAIPAKVSVRHTMWQQRRLRITSTDNLDSIGTVDKRYIDHPDINHAVESYEN